MHNGTPHCTDVEHTPHYRLEDDENGNATYDRTDEEAGKNRKGGLGPVTLRNNRRACH